MVYTLQQYFEGECKDINKIEESLLVSKNTGSSAEKYVESLLKELDVTFVKNKRIQVGASYIIPDFYLPEKDLILEVKSRGYNCGGTSSEKIDNIPRKYSKLLETEDYTHTKVVVVLCAYELLNKSTLELLDNNTKYSNSFLNLAKSFNVELFISVRDLKKILIDTATKPVIKWAGGKSKLKKKILEHFPQKFNYYHEPFIGGGAIGFSLPRDIRKTFCDINHNLILFYTVVKEKVNELITELSIQDKYTNTKECYLDKRSRFNQQDIPDVEKASLFLYLNKCCYNGLYRENKSGGFNVPFGTMKNPVICDTKNLKKLSLFLQNVELVCSDFSYVIEKSKKDDLVYFDPPYHNTFTDYTKHTFKEKEQIKLKQAMDSLTKKNVYVIISNSDTEFIRELYKEYTIVELSVKYSVGGDRKSKKEILIKN